MGITRLWDTGAARAEYRRGVLGADVALGELRVEKEAQGTRTQSAKLRTEIGTPVFIQRAE